MRVLIEVRNLMICGNKKETFFVALITTGCANLRFELTQNMN
jgi:hypothetical protein